MTRSLTLAVLFWCMSAVSLLAQKHAFRGVWVATVANIDFPSRPGLDTAAFQSEWLDMLALFRSVGLNAVFVQVRPAGDAFYRSRIAPWSKYLSGTQGKALAPGFDPLPFMIETAHDHQLEFHAWLNPYRAAMDSTDSDLADSHPYKLHPDWFVRYGGRKYFDPGIPEVRNYISEVVLELVTDYKVDGIHFDDYFYPYPVSGEEFPDTGSFERYGFGFSDKAAWRRDNTDRMIRQVGAMIKRVDPGVKFGVSPFGVWRNADRDPINGSRTQAGVNTYDDLYADVRGWLEKGWIDYVIPQLYWHVGFPRADYQTLVDWWQDNSFQRQLYIGMAAYKVGNNPEKAWANPAEIPRQIALNRSADQVAGEVYFNASSLRKNPLGLTDSLRRQYALPALWPPMPYLRIPPPAAPVLGRPTYRHGTVRIPCRIKASADAPAQYLLIYRFPDRAPGDFDNPENLLRIIPVNGRDRFLLEDPEPKTGDTFTYAAALTNKAYLESPMGPVRSFRVGKFLLRKTRRRS